LSVWLLVGLREAPEKDDGEEEKEGKQGKEVGSGNGRGENGRN